LARIAVGRCGSAAGSFAVAALLTGSAVGRCAAGLLSGLSALSSFSPSQEPGKTPEK